jgi:C1A family cysteine protease
MNTNVRTLVSIVLTLILLFSMLSVSAIAANPDDIDYAYVNYYKDDKNNIRREILDSKGREIKDDTDCFTDSFNLDSSSAPAKWDSRNNGWVTPVKDQYGMGTCWAFAFCAAVESSLIAQGYANADNIDLSEAHLAFFANQNYVSNSSLPVQRDRYTDTSDPYQRGGNSYYALATVSRWSGLTTETKFPYGYFQSQMQFDQKDMFERDYDVVSIRELNRNNISDIKQSIMNYGAVEASIYYGQPYLVRNTTDKTLYSFCNVEDIVNHSVTIVGWDDSISVDKFASAPQNNGAWLVKNSNGTGVYGGYFWLSYYDLSLSEINEIIARPAQYDNNYQYDGIETVYSISSNNRLTTANIFTAQGDEILKGCSFKTFAKGNCKVNITAYIALKDANNPYSGTKCETKTYSCQGGEFHVADFDGEYKIHKGERFAIVVTYSNSGGKVYVPVENKLYKNAIYDFDKGQSFYFDGSAWVDNTVAFKNAGNYTFKAYTANIKEYNNDAIFAAETSSVIIDNQNKIISGIDGNINDLVSVKNGYSFNFDAVGTGKTLKVFNAKNEQVDSYTILIYGDVNGDGLCDAQDAYIVDCIINGLLTEETVGNAVWLAADCNHDGNVDYSDYLLLNSCGTLIKSVNQTFSFSLS